MELIETLEQGPVPADGGMETMVLEATGAAADCVEGLCLSEPELIRSIHERCIAAGARLIRTNTLAANAASLAAHGIEHRVNELNWMAARLARDAARGAKVWVAGRVGPAMAADAAGRRALLQEQLGALLDGGVDVVFFESFTNPEELLMALEIKQSLHHCPAICSLTLEERPRIEEAFTKLRQADADVLLGLDGISPRTMVGLLESQPGTLSAFPVANVERPPGDFEVQARRLALAGARLIGGSRGAGIGHIAALAEALAGLDLGDSPG